MKKKATLASFADGTFSYSISIKEMLSGNSNANPVCIELDTLFGETDLDPKEGFTITTLFIIIIYFYLFICWKEGGGDK